MDLIINLIVYLVVFGLIWWLVSLLPLPAPVAQIVRVLFIILLILIVLAVFGIIPGNYLPRLSLQRGYSEYRQFLIIKSPAILLKGGAFYYQELRCCSWNQLYRTDNLKIVRVLYSSPGRNIIDGYCGWLIESGACWGSKQKPVRFWQVMPLPVNEPSKKLPE